MAAEQQTPQPEPDRRPRPSTIADAPATPAACAADFGNGTNARADSAKRDARGRR